jgi:hypothetical protein
MSEKRPKTIPVTGRIGVRPRKRTSPGKVVPKKSSAPARKSPTRTSGRKTTRTDRRNRMGLASCQIVGVAAWRVSHDGKADNVYETKKLLLKLPFAALH